MHEQGLKVMPCLLLLLPLRQNAECNEEPGAEAEAEPLTMAKSASFNAYINFDLDTVRRAKEEEQMTDFKFDEIKEVLLNNNDDDIYFLTSTRTNE